MATKKQIQKLQALRDKTGAWLSLAREKGVLKDQRYKDAAKQYNRLTKIIEKALVSTGAVKKPKKKDLEKLTETFNTIKKLFEGSIANADPDQTTKVLGNIENFLNEAEAFLKSAKGFAAVAELKDQIKEVEKWITQAKDLLDKVRKIEQFIIKKKGELEVLRHEFQNAVERSKEQVEISKQIAKKAREIIENAVAGSKKSDDAIEIAKTYTAMVNQLLSESLEAIDVVVGKDGEFPDWYKNIEGVWLALKPVMDLPLTEVDDEVIQKIEAFKTQTLEPFLQEAQKQGEKFKDYIKEGQRWLKTVDAVLTVFNEFVEGIKNGDPKQVYRASKKLIEEFEKGEWLPGTDWDKKFADKVIKELNEFKLKAATALSSLVAEEGSKEHEEIKKSLLKLLKSIKEYLDAWSLEVPDHTGLFLGEDKRMQIEDKKFDVSKEEADKAFDEFLPPAFRTSPLLGQVAGAIEVIKSDMLMVKNAVNVRYAKNLQVGADACIAFQKAHEWFTALKKKQDALWNLLSAIRSVVVNLFTLGYKALVGAITGPIQKIIKNVTSISKAFLDGNGDLLENVPVLGDFVQSLYSTVAEKVSFPGYNDKGLNIASEIEAKYKVATTARYNDLTKALGQVGGALEKLAKATEIKDTAPQEEAESMLEGVKVKLVNVKKRWDNMRKQIEVKYINANAPTVYREKAIYNAKDLMVCAWFQNMHIKGKKPVDQLDNEVVKHLKKDLNFFKRAGTDWPEQNGWDRFVGVVACGENKYHKRMRKCIKFAKKQLEKYNSESAWKGAIG